MSTMSKTFRDFITIARRLGVMYVWIDSLCIIQDSQEDWDRESVKMGEVYGRALLTVMASGAEDGGQGCFISRKKADSIPIAIDLIDMHGNRSSIFLALNPFENGARPLDNRGWTLQERQLSPRNIQYGVKEMVWECNEATWHEWEHVVFTFKELHTPENPEVLRYSGRLSDMIKNSADEYASRITWEMLTEDYSRRKLTRQTDKLPAMSAIAKAVQSITKDTYLTGLWQNDITKGLLWRRGSTEGQKAFEWRAPSWSWASMDGPILHYVYKAEKRGRTDELQVLEANVVPLGQDAYGRVRSGKLRVRARIKPVLIQGLEDSDFMFYNRFSYQTLYANAIIEPGWSEIGYALLDTATSQVQHLMLCLVMTNHMGYDHVPQDIAETLVLQSVQGCEYERIGVGVDVDARLFDGCEPECLTLV